MSIEMSSEATDFLNSLTPEQRKKLEASAKKVDPMNVAALAQYAGSLYDHALRSICVPANCGYRYVLITALSVDRVDITKGGNRGIVTNCDNAAELRQLLANVTVPELSANDAN